MTRQTTQLFRLADYLPDRSTKPKPTYFDRAELNQLLAVYSRHVIRGEWRDYAIDHGDGFALFSVYRHSQDSPAFRIVKCPGSGGRAGEYLLYGDGRRLRAARTLGEVLEVLRRKPVLVRGPR